VSVTVNTLRGFFIGTGNGTDIGTDG